MEAPDSIPQALFAPKGRNLPRKVKTPPQVDTLREYGSRQHVQVLCLKAETYPHKVKTSITTGRGTPEWRNRVVCCGLCAKGQKLTP